MVVTHKLLHLCRKSQQSKILINPRRSLTDERREANAAGPKIGGRLEDKMSGERLHVCVLQSCGLLMGRPGPANRGWRHVACLGWSCSSLNHTCLTTTLASSVNHCTAQDDTPRCFILDLLWKSGFSSMTPAASSCVPKLFARFFPCSPDADRKH